MLFAILCEDKPDALALRQSVRSRHLDYLHSRLDLLVEVGPLLDAQGSPCGSLLVVEVADRAAAEAFAAADPYAGAGVFARTMIHGYRSVFKAGAQVG